VYYSPKTKLRYTLLSWKDLGEKAVTWTNRVPNVIPKLLLKLAVENRKIKI